MRAVQWSRTGERGDSGAGYRRRNSYPRPGLWPPGPAGFPDVTIHGGNMEMVEMMDSADARDSAPDEGRFARFWPLLWLVWLPALVQPITAFLQARPAPPRLIAVLAGLALFIALYLWAAWHSDVTRDASLAPLPPASGMWRWVPIAVLATLSGAFILGDGPRWLGLLIYTCACATGRLPQGLAVRAVAALMLLTIALGWLTHDAWSDLALAPFWVGITGASVILMAYLRRTNRALRVARAEVARLAVEAERLRFARDLHDLLGHDLARIALQSEVVEALVPTAPERAIATAREMGEAARTALQEVRAAVAGYRQPTLASELRGAGEILAAAGISYRCEGERVAVPPAVEAALAWAVREGVTNAVKHSRARRCTIRVTQDVGYVGVEVGDDGPGRGAAGTVLFTASGGGSGLAGLAERAAALGGRCDAGPRPGGGFHLSVTLPLGTENGAERAAPERAVAIDAGGRL